MKRFLSIVLAVVMLCSMMPIAFAASDEASRAADSLYTLGLFQGKGTDAVGKPIYALDDVPTRHEAVTMLVRLLGKEDEAKAGKWETPFTDVDDWAKPYVGYAYANGLTTGTSATTFGGKAVITDTQYITFVLRAMGYTSGVDFQWNKAWELSDKLGITHGEYPAKTFLRGGIALISFSALDAKLKNSEDTLRSSLEKAGAIGGSEKLPFELTSGKLVGSAENVKFTVTDELSSGKGTVHGYTYQELDNGYTRFTLDYTVPEGLRIFVFDAPNGEKLGLRDDRGTAGTKSQLVFDVETALCSEVSNIVVNMYSDDNNRYMVVASMGGEEEFAGYRITPTDGKPVGTASVAKYTYVSWLSSGKGVVHSITKQSLDNDHTRFVLDYSAPAGLDILVYDHPNGQKVSQRDDQGTAGGRNTLVFDVETDLLANMNLLIVNIYHKGDDCFLIEIQPNK